VLLPVGTTVARVFAQLVPEGEELVVLATALG
jgi:hypothetical protein